MVLIKELYNRYYLIQHDQNDINRELRIILSKNYFRVSRMVGVVIYTVFFLLSLFNFWHFFLFKFDWVHLFNLLFAIIFFARLALSVKNINESKFLQEFDKQFSLQLYFCYKIKMKRRYN